MLRLNRWCCHCCPNLTATTCSLMLFLFTSICNMFRWTYLVSFSKLQLHNWFKPTYHNFFPIYNNWCKQLFCMVAEFMLNALPWLEHDIVRMTTWYIHSFVVHTKILKGKNTEHKPPRFAFVPILALMHTSGLWVVDDDQGDCTQGLCPCVS